MKSVYPAYVIGKNKTTFVTDYEEDPRVAPEKRVATTNDLQNAMTINNQEVANGILAYIQKLPDGEDFAVLPVDVIVQLKIQTR